MLPSSATAKSGQLAAFVPPLAYSAAVISVSCTGFPAASTNASANSKPARVGKEMVVRSDRGRHEA